MFERSFLKGVIPCSVTHQIILALYVNGGRSLGDAHIVGWDVANGSLYSPTAALEIRFDKILEYLTSPIILGHLFVQMRMRLIAGAGGRLL
jgi:hypothetical protein